MTPPPAEQFAARVFVGPTLRAQPDRRLVDLVRDGYDAAFEEIVRRYRRPLDRFAAAIVGGRSEDVTQDAFSKALLALRGSEAEIELRPWLYRIVRNAALNDLRGRGPIAEELHEGMPGGRSAAVEAEARQELRDLMDRLQALPEPQRAALVMRELEGLGHEEIAAALGVSGSAARQAIFRAREALRDGLGLLVPMPVVRALAEHAEEATRAGGAIAAGAGASSAGGAALGGLGAGALKVGVATVLIAGTVGAGVAIEHHRGGGPGPDAAEAAPLVEGAAAGARRLATGRSDAGGSSRSGRSDDGPDSASHRGEDRSGEGGGSLADEDRSGSDGGSNGSGERSVPTGHSGGESGHGGSGENSGPGSISGHGDGDDDGSGDHSGTGSGSDATGSDDHGGSSGSGSSDDGLTSGDVSGGDSSGPGSGEIDSDPVTTTSEPEIEDGSHSGSDGESSGPGSGGSDGGATSGLDGSP
jgi:RNA polymerase sigma factor (sigma-70 family)